ncbi:MAG: lipoyl(octanoyl) transferase [Clostridiales bacterium 38-18]|nr:MAG: lipoyl(octanoyl) transferase [Clostridiales bacterium 38-18]
MNLNIRDLGVINYLEAYDIQEKLLEQVGEGLDDQLLLLEHPKVITMGINAKSENILLPDEALKDMGFDIVRTRRGGDVTYHGPGQLVGYTIFNIKKNHGGSIKTFVHELEALFIELLQEYYDINAIRDEINSGVFVGSSKIVAIGLSVKSGITMHGFALNANTNLADFQTIVPCGLATRGVTSLENIIGHPVDMVLLKNQVQLAFTKRFGYSTSTGTQAIV